MIKSPLFFFISIIPMILFTAIMGLEIAIAFIQAMVFIILTSSYLRDSIYLHNSPPKRLIKPHLTRLNSLKSIYSYPSQLIRSYSTQSKSTIEPIKVYNNADTQKSEILRDNTDQSGVYRWINKINGKSYIGSAVNIKARLNSHYSNYRSNLLLQQAFKKYGLENFSVQILEYCDVTVLIDREQYYLNLLSPEYNISPTAGRTTGYKHTKKTIENMSLTRKGVNHPLYGKKHSVESLIRMKEAQLGKTTSEETRKKMSITKGGSLIYLYSVEEITLLRTFVSSYLAADYLKCSDTTVMKYAKSNYIFKDQYILSFSLLESDFTPTLPNFIKRGSTVFVYSLQSVLLHTFPSYTAATKFFNSTDTTIIRYIRSSKVFQDQYILSLESFKSDFIPVQANTQGSIIYVYSLNNQLLNSFTSATKAANFLVVLIKQL